MRLALVSFAMLSALHLDPCGGGGDGGGNPPGGDAPAPANGTPAAAQGGGGPTCTIFYDGWQYTTITSYEPGKDPVIGDISGTATFNRDGTFVEDYYIGSFSNHYEGTYTVDAKHLVTVDKFGNGTTTYDYVCSDDTKQLVLTIRYPDGTPQIITGLESQTP